MILLKITFTVALLLMSGAIVGLFIGFKDHDKFSGLVYKITISSLIGSTIVLLLCGIIGLWLKY